MRNGEKCHGFPVSVKSIPELTHLLTIIIFTCSCQHAAVNFSQMDTFGFPPNAPALMRQPPPTRKGVVTIKDVMKCLPTKHQAGVTIATVYDLTRIFPDEVILIQVSLIQNMTRGCGEDSQIDQNATYLSIHYCEWWWILVEFKFEHETHCYQRLFRLR